MKDKVTAGKLRLDLLPIRALKYVAQAFAWGIEGEGYPPWGWLTVDDWQDKYFASTMRHLFEWREGSTKDKKSNLHPLAHAGAGILILLARSITDGHSGLGRNSDESVESGDALHGTYDKGRNSKGHGPSKNRKTRASH